MLTMTNVLIAPAILASVSMGFLGYSILRSHFPGRGLKVVQNIFKQTISFEEALKVLKGGSRIRRKSERKGYTKLIITEGKKQRERFGTYWASSPDDISDYCSFTIGDVLATDWIVDE